MPRLVATTSALARKPCVSTYYARTNLSGHYVRPRTHNAMSGQTILETLTKPKYSKSKFCSSSCLKKKIIFQERALQSYHKGPCFHFLFINIIIELNMHDISNA